MALRNRKHVIVEKPMALTLEECEEMNSAADQYGLSSCVDVSFYFSGLQT